MRAAAPNVFGHIRDNNGPIGILLYVIRNILYVTCLWAVVAGLSSEPTPRIVRVYLFGHIRPDLAMELLLGRW